MKKCCVTIFSIFFAYLNTFSQEISSITASFAERERTIDGVLDESDWEKAEVITGFTQSEPEEGKPSSRRTEVRILFAEEDLYVAAVMYDDPDAVENTLGKRDELNRADWFFISIDSYFNRRTAYTFAVSAAGVQLDGQQNGDLENSWDAIWFSSVKITEEGWIAEIRIPYRNLRFQSIGKQNWGIHFVRHIPRLGEVSEWPYIPSTERTNLVAEYGQIRDITGLDPRRNLQVRPYILTGIDYFESPLKPGEGEHSTMLDIGGDLKLGFGSNIILDVTLNPDFGQVEADPAVLNLTAFETQFSERRPFFLEGADIFHFGYGDHRLFYSRRVGARDPIIGAVKISGRTDGRLSFGILGAVSGEGFNASHNYGVARARQELGEYSSIGGMLTTYYSPADIGIGKKSMTAGMDWDLRFLNNNYGFDGLVAFADRRSLIPGEDIESGFMTSLVFRKREGIVNGQTSLLIFSDRYNPNDVGWATFERNFVESWSGLTYNIKGGQPFGPFQNANVTLGFNQRFTYLEWWNQGDATRINTSWTTREFRNINFSGSLSNMFGGYDIWETRGLGRWAEPRSVSFSGSYGSDSRKSWNVSTRGNYQILLDGGRSYGITSNGKLDIGTRLSFSGNLRGGWEKSETAWSSNETFTNRNGEWMIGDASVSPDALTPEDFIGFDNSGLLGPIITDVNEYTPGYYYVPVFGERDTRSVDVTIRSNITLTKDLSFQLYTQLFLARGKYDNFGILVDPENLVEFPSYPKQRDFSYQNLQFNIVIRWEYRPGSTVYLVWSHSRSAREEMNPLAPWGPSSYDKPIDQQIEELFGAFPHHTVMLKFNYAFF